MLLRQFGAGWLCLIPLASTALKSPTPSAPGPRQCHAPTSQLDDAVSQLDDAVLLLQSSATVGLSVAATAGTPPPGQLAASRAVPPSDHGAAGDRRQAQAGGPASSSVGFRARSFSVLLDLGGFFAFTAVFFCVATPSLFHFCRKGARAAGTDTGDLLETRSFESPYGMVVC